MQIESMAIDLSEKQGNRGLPGPHNCWHNAEGGRKDKQAGM
jgi:hypothetical protein